MERGRLLDGRRERLKWDHQNNYFFTLPLDKIDFGLFSYNSKAKSFGSSTDIFVSNIAIFRKKILILDSVSLVKKKYFYVILCDQKRG